MTEEKPVFTKINNPVSFRKSELEGLREVIHILKSFERLRVTRTEKAEKTILLKKQCGEITSLLNALRDKFPHPIEFKKEPLTQKIRISKKGKLKKRKKTMNSLLDLENQLSEVQKRLDVIS